MINLSHKKVNEIACLSQNFAVHLTLEDPPEADSAAGLNKIQVTCSGTDVKAAEIQLYQVRTMYSDSVLRPLLFTERLVRKQL